MNETMTTGKDMTEARALRRTAAKIGFLYIIGTVAGCCTLSANSFMQDPGYLTKVNLNPTPVIMGALLVLTMGIALSLMSVLLYPVLRKYDQMLATGYLIFRGALETATYILTALCWLISAALGRVAFTTDTDNLSTLKAVSDALTDPRAGSVITTIFFIIGALMFYTVLYRSRLVPRWISAWGLASTLPYILSSALVLFGAIASGSDAECLLYLPMLLQEMVLAAWLIAKGFNPRAIGAQQATLV